MTKEEQRKKTCCFTGHRRISATEYETVKYRLHETIIRAIRNGYCYFGTGGSWGFDMLAAQTVLELKKHYTNIYLILVLPCKAQTKYWSYDNKKEYDRILNSADKVVWTSEEYTFDMWQLSKPPQRQCLLTSKNPVNVRCFNDIEFPLLKFHQISNLSVLAGKKAKYINIGSAFDFVIFPKCRFCRTYAENNFR